jgi:hypothetical protein
VHVVQVRANWWARSPPSCLLFSGACLRDAAKQIDGPMPGPLARHLYLLPMCELLKYQDCLLLGLLLNSTKLQVTRADWMDDHPF